MYALVWASGLALGFGLGYAAATAVIIRDTRRRLRDGRLIERREPLPGWLHYTGSEAQRAIITSLYDRYRRGE